MSADPPRQPNPILERLGRALEGALNRAVAMDQATRERLAAIEGQRIGIELRGMNLALAISVKEQRLCIGPHQDAPGDLNLRAAPGSLLAMALRRGEDSVLPPGKVEISGDAELARRVEKLARDFRPDIEEALARTFGDVIGVPLSRALQRAFAWSRESTRAMAHNAAEYLREESRDLIAPAEMEEFLDDVDALRERADRLEARVQRLAPRASGETP
ncbi:MAG: SCP2 sterol-binding domain-containing protein [Rudaea sp.]